jgi:hypothetical protein
MQQQHLQFSTMITMILPALYSKLFKHDLSCGAQRWQEEAEEQEKEQEQEVQQLYHDLQAQSSQNSFL